MDPHAQSEIREYASVIGEQIVSAWCPLAWEAFQDYRMGAMHLGKDEMRIVRALIAGKTEEAVGAARSGGLLPAQGPVKRSRERDELDEKLELLGLTPPWASTEVND